MEVELLTPEQVAELLHISTRTLANWRCAGVGPRYARVGGIRYRQSDVEDWIESRLKETENGHTEQRREMALPLHGGRPRVQRKHRLGGYQTKSGSRSKRGSQGEGTGAQWEGARTTAGSETIQ